MNEPPALNEKVLADKRKKLNETWDRLLKLYVSSGNCRFNLVNFVNSHQGKEEKERYGELKRLEGEYELKRRERKPIMSR